MRAYQSRKSATIVARPTKTSTVMLAAELPPLFLGIEIDVLVGDGAAD